MIAKHVLSDIECWALLIGLDDARNSRKVETDWRRRRGPWALAGRIFGLRQAPGLANPTLETLRLLAAYHGHPGGSRCHNPAYPPIEPALFEAAAAYLAQRRDWTQLPQHQAHRPLARDTVHQAAPTTCSCDDARTASASLHIKKKI